MPTLPADIVNRSLDALSVEPIGSFDDGTPVTEAARRAYGPALRQLLRAAHWSFARKMASLALLADASGQAIPPVSIVVEPPWQYAYAWPVDGVQAIWMPWQTPPNAAAPVPQMTGQGLTQTAITSRPARFLVSSSDEYPVAAGQLGWDAVPDLSGIEGQGLTARRVVLTNMANAMLVYTKLALEIEEWDALFSEAMAAVLASRLALVAVEDRKLALSLRQQQIAIAREAIVVARAASANDAGFPQSADHVPDWFAARGVGAGWWGNWGDIGFAGGAGTLFMGWSSFAFADGSVY